MEIEEIIKTKHYFELTKEELAEVSGYAKNEAEFDDMKSFLLATHQTAENQKIKETNELDRKVLNYLNSSYPQTMPWYNSVLLFLFPRDKSVFKYPAFQIGIASLLIFSIVNVLNVSDFEGKEMAYENVEKHKNKTIVKPEEIVHGDSFDLKTKSNGTDLLEGNRYSNDVTEPAIEQEDEQVEKKMFYDQASSFAVTDVEMVEEVDFVVSELSEEVVEEDLDFDEEVELEEAVNLNKVAVPNSVATESVDFKDVDVKRKEKYNANRAMTVTNANLEKRVKKVVSVKKQEPIQASPELINLFFSVD